MRGMAVLLCLLLFPTVANAYEAPFGLRWGMTVAEFKALVGAKNTTNDPEKHMPPGVIKLRFNGTPRTPENTYRMAAIFVNDAGLVKLAWASNEIIQDIYGIEGLKFYRQLKSIISEKYKIKDKTEIERIGSKFFYKRDEFYQCLDNQRCGAYLTVFMPIEGGAIGVRLEGLSRGRGFVSVDYEAPNWDASIASAHRSGTELDKKAF